MKELFDTETEIDNFLGHPHKCILFNDEQHSQDEVVSQIMKAINCGSHTAYEMMMTAHRTGSAVVFTGGQEKCELVASILEQIGLATSVEEA